MERFSFVKRSLSRILALSTLLAEGWNQSSPIKRPAGTNTLHGLRSALPHGLVTARTPARSMVISALGNPMNKLSSCEPRDVHALRLAMRSLSIAAFATRTARSKLPQLGAAQTSETRPSCIIYSPPRRTRGVNRPPSSVMVMLYLKRKSECLWSSEY